MTAHLRGARGLVRHLPPLLWLALVWTMLWGTFSVGNLVAGLLVGLVVTAVLPLPVVVLGGRLDPLALLGLLAHMLRQLVVSSAHLAWLSLRPGPPPLAAVVAVPLRSRSDLLVTLTAEAVSLTPGSLVLEVSRRTLYCHVLDVSSAQEAQRFRTEVLDLERRIVRAVGGPSAIARLAGAPPVPDPPATAPPPPTHEEAP
ncbi:Na+/H+ antiporter subunit E [Vallicoccus soli]|uniref:Na+/H+ antiporter subunit E n=1 Tax=Vallicoccus soli TaxID=2339232 RepID=A0A3A3YWP0_9ACTN|nr:Na+/H+ antiporter subunit E [Vallicoccus soli]RJK95977.1 Na+/H+ antiporter subunit E [Vallicoccus soli]